MGTRNTQQVILDAAIELFNTWGTPRVSTNQIAAACGLSRGHLHYHFHTKPELIQCIVSRIATQMAARWEDDMAHPTLARLAQMFARQALLTHRYRFFYREQSDLLRSDPVLLGRYRELIRRRVTALEDFFLELDRTGVMQLGGDRRLVHSLVRGTWIIADNWLNSVEFLGEELTAGAIKEGYELILDVFKPYLLDEETVRRQAQLVLDAQIHSFGSQVRTTTAAENSGRRFFSELSTAEA